MGKPAGPPPLIGGQLYKVNEAATVLNVHRSMIYTLCGRGDLAYVRVGSKRRIPRAAIDAYLQSRLVTKDAA